MPDHHRWFLAIGLDQTRHISSKLDSVVGRHCRGRITLSVPTLVEEGGGLIFGQLLAERREGRAGLVTESELCESGQRRGLLLFAPDAQ